LKIKDNWQYYKWDRKRKCAGGGFVKPRKRTLIICRRFKKRVQFQNKEGEMEWKTVEVIQRKPVKSK